MNKTIVINLIGAPCAGKSTLAALIFSKLKMQNVSCEIVTEFAKDLVWNESLNGLNNQLYVLSEQFYRIWRLQNKVDVVITDSPVLLSIYYNKKQKEENKITEELFDNLVMECYNKFDNINYFLKRSHKYQTQGRKHSEQESIQIEKDMLKLYNDFNIKYTETHCSEAMADMIVDNIKKKLEEK
ncbi:AAA family ATPase [uncultured Clostridium sp.]|uniref:AAA family ATPase n=1 Tax=uncultured Clostridium sp. TaxID=59620 RepID=UPI00260FBE60|nr:AAA family ATPase [uncultured Clostridium sp.]